MALVRNWRYLRFVDPLDDVLKECKVLNLKGCKRLLIKFDPFREDVKVIRDFNHFIYTFQASKSNLNLPIKTEILTDRSEQSITVDLINGEKLVVKCALLSLLDIFKILNEHVTPLAPEEIVQVQTKALKKKFR